MSLMLDEDCDRALLGLHPDPHTILGVHEAAGVRSARIGADSGSKVWVAPLGSETWVRLNATRVVRPQQGPMRSLYSAEVSFFGPLAVRVQSPAGVQRRELDPYTFSPSVGEQELSAFAHGHHHQLSELLGARVLTHQGVRGTRFTVWAPSALAARVVGDFNDWVGAAHAMRRLAFGVWELFIPRELEGAHYKFEIVTRKGVIEKSDPLARAMELRPNTASIVWVSRHEWKDADYRAKLGKASPAARSAMSIYEVHLGSWKRPAAGEGIQPPSAEDLPFPSYRALADELVDYVHDLGFTHIELLPVTEHPYDGSWGYQVSGYFSPTARHGTPDDFKYFVDKCHSRGIGVLLDWVPAHFPRDAAALGRFDGTPLYEHWNPLRGEHRQWETFIFDWGRPEVKNFLISSALHFLEEYHLDGLRVDAVASMLYLDYAANHPSQWEPNVHGGRENLEAVAFLRELTSTVHERCPAAILAAEESTSWPGVTRPAYAGGLGFDLKWNMGWMHDSLNYFSLDPIFRSYRHTLLTFGLMYAFSERYVLPFSHDEVVHLKRSLHGRMPGDAWQKAATLRSMYAFMWSHPGKKLLFMGGELGQRTEWNEASELPWELLADPLHRGLQAVVRELNRVLRAHPALYELDDEQAGFQWIDANDAPQSVISFVRFARSQLLARPTGVFVVVVGNFTPIIRREYRVGVPRGGRYRELLNTDAAVYGGSNVGNLGLVESESSPSHGFAHSLSLTLPPLGVLYLVPEDEGAASEAELLEEAQRLAARATPRELDGPSSDPKDPTPSAQENRS
jgi:1,4-alpha-glucan branching enzyme